MQRRRIVTRSWWAGHCALRRVPTNSDLRLLSVSGVAFLRQNFVQTRGTIGQALELGHCANIETIGKEPDKLFDGAQLMMLQKTVQ